METLTKIQVSEGVRLFYLFCVVAAADRGGF